MKSRKPKKYEEIPHTADLAARIYGRDVKELFENAAFAMFDMMAEIGNGAGKGRGRGKGRSPHAMIREADQWGEKFTVEKKEYEELLIAFLNEVLYRSFKKKLVFEEFNVLTLDENKLTAEAYGTSNDFYKGKIKHEIKAATYHDVEIKKTDSGYEVVLVFDI